MPVEQGLPWHPVATGLAGQAIPFIVAASHAHALPSAPFWFPVPAVLVASPALLCPSSLFAVLARVPPGVAPAFCVSVLLLPLSFGAAGCPCRAPPPVPPACPPVRGFHISIRRGLSRARLAGHGPVATPVAGTSRRAGRSPRPCGVCGHLVGGGGVFGDGSLGVRCIWWLLLCLHLLVPLCVVVCPVGARLTAPPPPWSTWGLELWARVRILPPVAKGAVLLGRRQSGHKPKRSKIYIPKVCRCVPPGTTWSALPSEEHNATALTWSCVPTERRGKSLPVDRWAV